jgi:Fic family protein
MKDTWHSTDSPGELLSLVDPKDGPFKAFLPYPLPPDLQIPNRILRMLAKADHSLGRLSELGMQLPNTDLLTFAFMRREAVLSSKIESIHTTVTEVYQFEMEKVDRGRGYAREAFNNFEALRYGLDQIQHRGLSLGLIRELHERLMHEVLDERGREKNPGAFRQRQNFIGRDEKDRITDALYVPPPPDRIHDLLQDWELFVNEDNELPILIKIVLAHYQFEAIHPFEDGNGRVGRLINSLMLQREGLLVKPILSLSAYLAAYRQGYYTGLRGITYNADWFSWLKYFLKAVRQSATDAIVRSQKIIELRDFFLNRVKEKTRGKAVELVDFMFRKPVFTQADALEHFNVSQQAMAGYFRLYVKLELIEDTTGKYNNRIYQVPELLKLLEA